MSEAGVSGGIVGSRNQRLLKILHRLVEAVARELLPVVVTLEIPVEAGGIHRRMLAKP
jgi:hypothetical protein